MTHSTRERLARDISQDHSTQIRASKFALIVGFVALYLAIVSAYQSPATAYEVSIYAATPDGFWAGIGIAVVCGLLVAWFVTPTNRIRTLAILLVASAIVAVAALPIIRGYFFVGAGDSLTHLGWMRDIESGALSPLNFLYPGIHTAMLFIAQVAGMSLERATEFLVLAYFVSFVLFTGLTVHLIAKTKHALLFGVFSALLALPINNISVHLMAHPSTEAILYLPLVLYLTVRYLTQQEPSVSVWRLSINPSGVLLVVALAAILLIHPQVAGNVILIYVSIAFLQLVFRQLRSEHAISNHRPLYAHTVYFITIFLLWAPRYPRTTGTVETIINAVFYGVSSSSAIAQRESTLAAIGGSLPELFAKLFLLSFVFAVLAGLVMLLSLGRRFQGSYPVGDSIIRYFTLSMVPLFGMFLLFSLLQGSTQRFRYLGFVMVLLTILGAVMLAWGFEWLTQRTSARVLRTVVVVAFVLMLPLGTVTLFSSPFIYQPTSHVSESAFHGYKTAFDYQDSSIPITGINNGRERYVQAIYGTSATDEGKSVPGANAEVPKSAFAAGNLTEYYSIDRYIIFSEATPQREIQLYQGVRFPEAGFDALNTTPGIGQVHSNGDVRVYLLRST